MTGKGTRIWMIIELDSNTIISVVGLAVGSGAVVKLFHISSMHGKYTLKVDTLWDAFLETSKAAGAEGGLIRHGSDYYINLARLGEMIEAAGYVPDPELLDYFRALASDPRCPDDDSALWQMIQIKWGIQRLIQEAARFNAPAASAPAIWVLCIRAAQIEGVDKVLREIRVIR